MQRIDGWSASARQRALIVSLLAADLIGAAIATAMLLVIFPVAHTASASHTRTSVAVAIGYTTVAMALALVVARPLLSPIFGWAVEGRIPLPRERARVLNAPRTLAKANAIGWLGGAVAAGWVGQQGGPLFGLASGASVALAGLSVAAMIFLMTERLLRPLVSRALAMSAEAFEVRYTAATRIVLTWLAVTGSALVVELLVAAMSLARPARTSVDHFAVVTIALTLLAFTAGGLSTFLAARANADPIVSLHDAMGEVHAGRLDTRVDIWDGTELGALQIGFNKMVVGLAERERVWELFGRHVGEEVAKEALVRGIVVGGERREVSVMFVDIVGSTALAQRLEPSGMVDLLNRFFSLVVEVVHAHGGWINKFQGDAALAVWGAPESVEGHAAAALQAARELHMRLRRHLPDLRTGIGVSSGEVVAGNIGSDRRYEYTVIGDAVNEASRLADFAKGMSGLAANAAMLQHADGPERLRWTEGREVELRGRHGWTRVAELSYPDRGVRRPTPDLVDDASDLLESGAFGSGPAPAVGGARRSRGGAARKHSSKKAASRAK